MAAELALERSVGGKPDVWLLETARDSLQRFTFGKAYPAQLETAAIVDSVA
jgi:hypothetical protein